MNSLVVLFCVLAAASAVPSYGGVLAPVVYTAPAAVSHQSRVDVHSSPLVSYASPLAYSAPWSYGVAPLADHVPAVHINALGVPVDTPAVAVARAQHLHAKALTAHGLHGHYLHKRSLGLYAAPAAISHQSRVDVHSSPVVSYTSPLAYSAPLAYAAPWSYAAAPLADHVPAVHINALGVPLDTPAVALARAQHLQAKALTAHGLHGHYLHKRSLGVYAAPAAVSHQSRVDFHSTPVVSYAAPWSHAAAPLAYTAPLAYSSPLHYAAKAYSVHPW